MNTTTFSNQQLRQAAAAVRRSMLQQYSASSDDHIFSELFLTKTARLIRHEKRRQHWITASKRAAAVLLALLIGAGAWLTFDVEARASVLQWFREVYENSVVYRFTEPSPPSSSLPQYELSWLPEGFERKDGSNHPTLTSHAYFNSDGDVIVFSYGLLSSNSYLQINDTELSLHEQISFNNITADFYHPTESTIGNALVWIDETQNIYFSIVSTLKKDIILHIAENIILVTPTN